MPAASTRKAPVRRPRAGSTATGNVGKVTRKPVPRVAVADSAVPTPGHVNEPVWLVRAVLVLFLVGFAAFLARELRNFLSSFA